MTSQGKNSSRNSFKVLVLPRLPQELICLKWNQEHDLGGAWVKGGSTQIIESQNILCWKGPTGMIKAQLLAQIRAAEASKFL